MLAERRTIGPCDTPVQTEHRVPRVSQLFRSSSSFCRRVIHLFTGPSLWEQTEKGASGRIRKLPPENAGVRTFQVRYILLNKEERMINSARESYL